MSPIAVTGSAERWGPLWGARPGDWALSEDQQVPTYEDAMRRVGLRPGQRVLDIGCGAGAFLRLVAAAASTAFAALAVGLGAGHARSPRSLFRHPGPLLLSTTAALAWWGAL